MRSAQNESRSWASLAPRSASRWFLAVLIPILFSQAAHAGFNRWTSGGPWAASVTAIAVDPADPQTVYAASWSDGIFRTRDGGTTWLAIDNGLVDLQITSLAVDPFSPSTVYAGSTSMFIYKSTDRGDHWVSEYVQTQQNAYEEVTGITLDPSTPGVVYATTFGGAWKSIDGGCAWFPINNGLPPVLYTFDVQVIAVDPANSLVLYLGTFQNGAYKSVDGGASWNPINTGLLYFRVNGLAVDPDVAGRVYAATDYFTDPGGESGGAIFRSDDGGGLWTKIDGLPNAPFQGVVMDAFHPGAVYAAASIGGVFQSANGSAPWAALDNGLPSTSVGVIASGTVAGQFWVGSGGAGVFRSDDGGQTWMDTTAGLAGFDATGIVIDPAANATIWTANYWGGGAGVFKSIDSGRTWLNSSSGLPDNAVYSLGIVPGTPPTLFVGLGFHGGIYRSGDGGASWLPAGALPQASTPDVYAFIVPPTDPSKIYAEAGSLFVSTDNGDSWAPTSMDNHSLYATHADSQTAGTLYAWVDNILQKSVDSGATWNPSNTGMGAAAVGVIAQSPADPQVLLAGGLGDAINGFEPLYRSADSGASWSPVTGIANTNAVYSIAFDPSDASRVYASVSDSVSSAIYRSLDGGLTWNPYGAGFPAKPWNTARLAVSSNGALVHAAAQGAVFELTLSATPMPEVLAVAPISGSAAGGTSITITGSGFGAGATVEIGGVAATDVQIIDDGHILATTAAGPSGAASVTVTIPEPQFDTLSRGFVYDFADLPPASPFYGDVTEMALRGVTGGCGGGNFCPTSGLNRGQAAVQIEKALRGADYPFDAPYVGPGFPAQDLDRCSGFAPYIYQFVLDGITAGCSYTAYCQYNPVTRAQIAVFLLRAKHGPGYLPPPATGTAFADVPIDAFAANYIEEAAAEQITAGCGGGNYCPDATVTRAQAAVLINRTLPAAP
jgi:photosystem II stability/assembly factor-like uncharacterized protein